MLPYGRQKSMTIDDYKNCQVPGSLLFIYIYSDHTIFKETKAFFLSDSDCQIQAVDGFSRKYCMFENDLFLGTFYIITPC